MPIRLKDYGRNQKKHKEVINQSGLLLAGVDESKGKHDSRIGTLEGVRCRNAWVSGSLAYAPRLKNLWKIRFFLHVDIDGMNKVLQMSQFQNVPFRSLRLSAQSMRPR